MAIAFTKLPGLDADRLIAVVEPVLAAHRVEGVELIWKTDRGGMVLELSIERADAQLPGDGITIDVCTDVSRDLSAALDALDVIGPKYRLEVGSPGVERTLYSPDDARRFAGQLAKIKIRQPLASEGPLKDQRVLRGNLLGLTETGQIQIDTEFGVLAIDWDNVSLAKLVFDWDRAMQQSGRGALSADGAGSHGGKKQSARKPHPKSAHPKSAEQEPADQKPRTQKRST